MSFPSRIPGLLSLSYPRPNPGGLKAPPQSLAPDGAGDRGAPAGLKVRDGSRTCRSCGGHLVLGLSGVADPLQPLPRRARSPGLTSLTSPCQSLSVRSPSMSPPACAGRLHRRLPSPPPAPVAASTPAPRSRERAGHHRASAPPPPARLPPRQPPRRKGRRSRAPTTALQLPRGRGPPRRPEDPRPPAASLREGSRPGNLHTIPDPIIPRPAVREGGWRTGGCHPNPEKPNSPIQPSAARSGLHHWNRSSLKEEPSISQRKVWNSVCTQQVLSIFFVEHTNELLHTVH